MKKTRHKGSKQATVCWHFEPCHPQRITSGLKQTSTCLLFTHHTSHQTINYLKTTKSVLTHATEEEENTQQRMFPLFLLPPPPPALSLVRKTPLNICYLCEGRRILLSWEMAEDPATAVTPVRTHLSNSVHAARVAHDRKSA